MIALCFEAMSPIIPTLEDEPSRERLFGNKLKAPTTHGSRSGVVGGRTLFPSGIFKYQRGGQVSCHQSERYRPAEWLRLDLGCMVKFRGCKLGNS